MHTVYLCTSLYIASNSNCVHSVVNHYEIKCSTMNIRALIFLFCLLCSSQAYKILVSYGLPVKSLNILGEGYVRHLIEAGHDVTFITAFPTKNPPKNLRQIDISSNNAMFEGDQDINIEYLLTNPATDTDNILYLQQACYDGAKLALEHENVQNLLKDPNERFDLVISDFFESELYSGLSVVFDCPYIWAYSLGIQWSLQALIDESTNPAYTTDYTSSYLPPLTFSQRLTELWKYVKRSLQKRFLILPTEESSYQTIFGPLVEKRGRKLPPYHEVIYNASMVLSNDYPIAERLPATPQNFKFIGGYHIQNPVKPLPKDLQTLMDNSKNGVIYFSLGSFWKSKDIPKPLTQSLVKMFGELKETVIWKYEEDLPNLPNNLHILKWAPQPSILAHPNCLMFITHGGHLSSTEAIYFGVPTIGIPIFVDQFVNINKAVSRGYAIRVDLSYDLPRNLKNAILTMKKDQRYREAVKKLSEIYHDRSMLPGKELVHWVEHVIRTRGAMHLRSPAQQLLWYEKFYLDLAATILITFVATKIVIKKLCSKLFTKKKVNADKKKK